MMLITNLKSDDKRLSVAVVKVYLMRWKIEEYYRFKKQQFNLEDMRVRSLNSIRNLELLITVAVGYIGFVSEKCEERITVMQLIECPKRIFGTKDICSIDYSQSPCWRALARSPRCFPSVPSMPRPTL